MSGQLWLVGGFGDNPNINRAISTKLTNKNHLAYKYMRENDESSSALCRYGRDRAGSAVLPASVKNDPIK